MYISAYLSNNLLSELQFFNSDPHAFTSSHILLLIHSSLTKNNTIITHK